MRLINATTYKIHEFFGDKTPPYAILSHTWGDEEVSFKDMQQLDDTIRAKSGFTKIRYTCKQALRNDLQWAWVDTCCIDKSSSAELSEAINSMYAWYSQSSAAYAYLADVDFNDYIEGHSEKQYVEDRVMKSRWFTRGWTLQELIAPRKLDFYSAEWRPLGCKEDGWLFPPVINATLLAKVTGVPLPILEGRESPSAYSVAQRFSWASARQCTRVEDVAYCLMGLFGIHMPLLYGEGPNAFRRLQEEILRETDDNSLFAWTVPNKNDRRYATIHGVFARSPADFARSSNIISDHGELGEPATMTRRGLRISLPLVPVATEGLLSHLHTYSQFLAILNCREVDVYREINSRVCLRLFRSEFDKAAEKTNSLCRYITDQHVFQHADGEDYSEPARFATIYIPKTILDSDAKALTKSSSVRIRGVNFMDELETSSLTFWTEVFGSHERRALYYNYRGISGYGPTENEFTLTATSSEWWNSSHKAFVGVSGPLAVVIKQKRTQMVLILTFEIRPEGIYTEACRCESGGGTLIPEEWLQPIVYRKQKPQILTVDVPEDLREVVSIRIVLDNDEGDICQHGTSAIIFVLLRCGEEIDLTQN